MRVTHLYTGEIVREKMSREEYLESCRLAIIETASEMLDGRMGFLLGSRALWRLLCELGCDAADADVRIFMAIDSETDALPLGEVRQHWDQAALERLEPEIREAERWAREAGESACISLIQRFEAELKKSKRQSDG